MVQLVKYLNLKAVFMAKVLNFLWFDDDFENAPIRTKLWTRWCESRKAQFKLISAGTISEFVRELQQRHTHNEAHDDYLHAILLDVMLRVPAATNFESLGFPKTKWLALDAGAQILGLMKNASCQAERPDFLKTYEKRPVALLTSQTTVKETWSKFVEHNVRNNSLQVSVLIKDSLVMSTQTEPRQDFQDWLNGIYKKVNP